MKKIGIFALLLVVCILGCTLTACTFKGTVPQSLIDAFGFKGLEIVNNTKTKYYFGKSYFVIRTNIASYEEYKAYCEYLFNYVKSIDGVVVAGSVEYDRGYFIVDEFQVDDEDYSYSNHYAFTTHEIGEDGKLSEVFDIFVGYSTYASEHYGYNLRIELYNSKNNNNRSWYYKGDKV